MGLDSNREPHPLTPARAALMSCAVYTLDVAPRATTSGAVDLTDKTKNEHVYSAYKVRPRELTLAHPRER